MQTHFTAVGIGEILWDLLPSGRQMGGAPANFAWFARALGAQAYVVSSVGNDRLGREILAKLKKMGFGRRYIARDKSHPTGVVEVRLDRNGQPSYDIKRNVAWDFIPFSRQLAALACKTDAVCFGTLAQRSSASRHAIQEFIRHLPDAALKVFDINLRQSFYNRKTIEQLLKLANVLKINDAELRKVSALFKLRGHEEKIVRQLMRRYDLRVVAVTKGAEGAALYCPKGIYSSKCRKVKVVDTVGAGDAFTAALVMGLLDGLKMKAIVERANRLASCVCSRQGATPALPAEIRRSI